MKINGRRFTDDEVKVIRNLAPETQLPPYPLPPRGFYLQVSKAFKTTPNVIRRIMRGQTYKQTEEEIQAARNFYETKLQKELLNIGHGR
jgi:hypothetical protein